MLKSLVMKLIPDFASDNTVGVHPDILNAMISANKGGVVSYGDDEYTKKADKK